MADSINYQIIDSIVTILIAELSNTNTNGYTTDFPFKVVPRPLTRSLDENLSIGVFEAVNDRPSVFETGSHGATHWSHFIDIMLYVRAEDTESGLKRRSKLEDRIWRALEKQANVATLSLVTFTLAGETERVQRWALTDIVRPLPNRNEQEYDLFLFFRLEFLTTRR